MREYRDILALYDSLGEVSAVVATVVDVRGSSYRRPGARLLIAADGRHVGSISGGCLEKDLIGKAARLALGGPVVVDYDTRGDEVRPAGEFNTGCDGVVRVLIERATDDAMSVPRTALSGAGVASATIFEIDRKRQDLKVADRLSLATTRCFGGELSLFGKRMEEALSAASELRRATSQRVVWPGGEVRVLIEPCHPPRPLIIFGDGDDVRPLTELAQVVGWQTFVCGKRPTFSTRERFPAASAVRCGMPEEMLATLTLTRRTAVALLTHDFADDKALLPKLLASPCYYVGLLGPKKRAARLMSELHAEGRLPSIDQLAKLRSPAGLDLGGDEPASVALSVLSEMEALANDREGGPLRDRHGGIHDEALPVK